jgi:two-component system sensor histidine kinase UhpB
MPLFWRVLATNAVVLAAATVVLVVSPVTVSSPVAPTEVVVLGLGLLAMVALNLLLLRRAFAPLHRLKQFMREVDPLSPGRRAPVQASDPEVAELTEAFNDMIGRLETERRESAHRALAAQEGERVRIARDLHDDVGQALTGVMLELEQAMDVAPHELGKAVARTRDEVRESLEELREIGRRLRPEALDQLGLVSALTALTTDVSRQSGVGVRRRIDGRLSSLSAEEDVVLYRIAQEALTNVIRHAKATTAMLELRREGSAVVLTITDDGVGFDAAQPSAGIGIRGMRERAVMIGARLAVRSRAGSGTTVRLALPIVD